MLTDSKTAQFQLQGHARAVANTSIGAITLDPIDFDVTSSLDGLQGLKGMTTIEGVDVVGGSAGGLELAVNGEYTMRDLGLVYLDLRARLVSIFNPSNLNLDTGDLSPSSPLTLSGGARC
jgi:hypothetical protein